MLRSLLFIFLLFTGSLGHRHVDLVLKKKFVSFSRNVLLIVADDAGRQLGHLGDPLV